jgi:DNA-binding CsgD family transcriptional regulator
MTAAPSGRQARLPRDPGAARPPSLLQERDRRISELLAAGHTVEHIVEIGRYQQTWKPTHVAAVLRSRGLPPPRLEPLRAAEIIAIELPARQVDVLRLMCMALDDEQIAGRLRISKNTVKSHVKAVLRTMGARDRLHAVVMVLCGAVRINLKEEHRA